MANPKSNTFLIDHLKTHDVKQINNTNHQCLWSPEDREKTYDYLKQLESRLKKLENP